MSRLESRPWAELNNSRERARQLKRDILALYLASRDPRTPWYAKAFAGVIVAYAVSPLDLIPDFVPVLGYLDDLVIIPAGLMLSLKLIPPPVLTECREEPQLMAERPTSRVGIVVVVSVWLSAVVPTALLLARPFELI